MHEYTLCNHDRKNIYYTSAILSSLAGGGIAFAITKLNSSIGITLAAPSGFAVFGLIFLLFDNFIWKIPKLYEWGLIKIPNLNGDWDAEISSSGTQEPIPASISISQTYTKIRIRLDTQKSQSLSKMATLEMIDPECFKLRYEYLAEYHKSVGNTLWHHGVSEITLKSKTANFDSSYSARFYTEMDRDTSGLITLTKRKP